MSGMECPRCRTLLRVDEYEGVEVDLCPKCKGVWLDEGELRPILDKREKTFSADEIGAVEGVHGQVIMEDRSDADGGACPKCGKTMDEYNYAYDSGVLLDRCKGHGIWLDAGELEKVQVLYEDGLSRLEQDKAHYASILGKIEQEVDARYQGQDTTANPARFSLFRGLVSGLLFNFWKR